ncbi:hypothetical protein [Endobacterium cereale]|uniref:hypothetical protein n=1 Tax=Endobacterium cereale TaxID=2663029 RepID=UPI002B4920EE|nr:hypothetical protein [Endobacterium cereale]MEB2848075.1 hypothetical protein [Endobacterium cereale]
MSTILVDRIHIDAGCELTTGPSYPSEHAGPVFFAANAVKSLQSWPSDRLRSLGSLPYPMGYNHHNDRYEIKLWSEILKSVAQAVTRCKVITLVGGGAVSAELDSLETLFHHIAGKMVESMQFSSEAVPGTVWPSTNAYQAEPVSDEERVVIALGPVPPICRLGNFHRCTTLFIDDHFTEAMVDISGSAFVAPVSAGGWKLSHIAFRRLLDIETEMAAGENYRRLYDEVGCFRRPLCYIMADLLRKIREERSRT